MLYNDDMELVDDNVVLRDDTNYGGRRIIFSSLIYGEQSIQILHQVMTSTTISHSGTEKR